MTCENTHVFEELVFEKFWKNPWISYPPNSDNPVYIYVRSLSVFLWNMYAGINVSLECVYRESEYFWSMYAESLCLCFSWIYMQGVYVSLEYICRESTFLFNTFAGSPCFSGIYMQWVYITLKYICRESMFLLNTYSGSLCFSGKYMQRICISLEHMCRQSIYISLSLYEESNIWPHIGRTISVPQ